jgi:hypothetical protein
MLGRTSCLITQNHQTQQIVTQCSAERQVSLLFWSLFHVLLRVINDVTFGRVTGINASRNVSDILIRKCFVSDSVFCYIFFGC